LGILGKIEGRLLWKFVKSWEVFLLWLVGVHETKWVFHSSNTDGAIRHAQQYTGCHDWLPIDSRVLRMDDGMADILDSNKAQRIAACGNGQVPLQAALAFILLKRDLCRY